MDSFIEANSQFTRTALEDVCKAFDIQDDLYEKYILGEIEKDKDLISVSQKRSVDDWTKQFPLGGPGTWLNGFVIYSLIRHFEAQSCLETGVSAGVYTSFMLAACKRNKSDLVSLEISDNLGEIGKLIPEKYKKYDEWSLIYGKSSLDFLSTNKKSFDFYSHDSLHTLSHMTKEFSFFKKSNRDRFLIYIDDQNSDNFWQILIEKNLLKKNGYTAKIIDGSSSRLQGHLGGFISSAVKPRRSGRGYEAP